MKKHTDLKRLNSTSDKTRTPPDDRDRDRELVGNDFDLYILLKEMLSGSRLTLDAAKDG